MSAGAVRGRHPARRTSWPLSPAEFAALLLEEPHETRPWLPLEDLLRGSDVVSLHLRLSDKTRGVLGTHQLSLMKPTAFLVNTARGPLVDEPALIAILRARRIAGAALDVYDIEPLPASHPFLALDNIVLTPHAGYVTREAYQIFFEQAVTAIEAYLGGGAPPRTLNPEATAHRRR